MSAWKLHPDAVFILFMPDGTIKNFALGENVSVPLGTKLGISGAVSYTHSSTQYPVADVQVGIDVTIDGITTGYGAMLKFIVPDPGDVVMVASGPPSGWYVLTSTCQIQPQLLYTDTQGNMISVNRGLPISTVTVTPETIVTPAPVPLGIAGVNFTDSPLDHHVTSRPIGSTYGWSVDVWNSSLQTVVHDIYVTVNGVQQPPLSGSFNPGYTHSGQSMVTSTGTDIICASINQIVEPTPSILEWIESHPVETVAVAGVVAVGVVYLATRTRKSSSSSSKKR